MTLEILLSKISSGNDVLEIFVQLCKAHNIQYSERDQGIIKKYGLDLLKSINGIEYHPNYPNRDMSLLFKGSINNEGLVIFRIIDDKNPVDDKAYSRAKKELKKYF